jgi:protein-tyrosine phosphatase
MSKTGRYVTLDSVHKNLYISDIQHVEVHWREYDHVVSICQHCELPNDLLLVTSGWSCYPMDDKKIADPEAIDAIGRIMRKASREILRALGNNERVLLHCSAGQNRSAAVAAMVAMKLHKCTPDVAIDGIIADKANAGLSYWPTLTNQSFRALLQMKN